MKTQRLTFEQILYALALTLALGLRLISLGSPALSDVESSRALQALAVAQGEPAGGVPLAGQDGELPAQPAYDFLTGIVFFLFGSSNTAARLWPALIGSSFVFLPLFFRKSLGSRTALWMAFGLALDPGLVSLSRQADSPVLAAGFVLFALGLAYSRQPLWAGVFAGLGLLSGPAGLHGLLGIFLAWVAYRQLQRSGRFYSPNGFGKPGESPGFILRAALPALLAALFVGSTVFFRFPQGLGEWLEGLTDYLAGWVSPSDVPGLRLLAALAVYQPIAFVFGLVGLFRLWQTSRVSEESTSPARAAVLFFVLWFLFSLVLALLYPARQMGDLSWALVPLWGLAAVGLSSLLDGEIHYLPASLGQAALVFTLLALVWINLAGLNQTSPGMDAYLLRLGLGAGVIALAGLTTLLVGMGWSWDVARRGLLWGSCAALGLYFLSCSFRLSFFAPIERPDVQELWTAGQQAADVDLLLKTVDDLARMQTGRKDGTAIVIQLDSPSLYWALHAYPQARFLSGSAGTSNFEIDQPNDSMPPIIITRQNQDAPSLSAAYRGQDFAWWTTRGWNGALPPDFVRWLIFRQAPIQQEQVILWARADLFPGESLATDAETLSPEPSDEEAPEIPQLVE